MKKIKGFKAFNKDMTCRGFKYEEGKTYKSDKAEICSSGFHFCENPFDILNYYDLCESEFKEGGMKKYKVSWIEIHEAIVEAEDTSQAREIAEELDHGATLRYTDDNEVELIGNPEPDDMGAAHSKMEE